MLVITDVDLLCYNAELAGARKRLNYKSPLPRHNAGPCIFYNSIRQECMALVEKPTQETCTRCRFFKDRTEDYNADEFK